MTSSVNDQFDFAFPVPRAEELGPVHFVAIGGAGVSGVARLFLARGIAVSGSDAKDSPALHRLADLGARVHVGHDPAYLGQARTVVVSSAVRESNPELAAARRKGLLVLHRAQGIAALLQDHDTVAVAGANGKTTTCGMAIAALQAAGADPSYVIGAALGPGGVSAAPGTGSAFVVEADESDGSFLVYRPQVAVVTNIRADHIDFYGDLAAIERAFTGFASTIRPGGLLVTGADDPGARALARSHAAAGGAVLTFGRDCGADVVVGTPRADGMVTHTQLHWAGRRHDLSVPMPGTHNVLNAAGAFAACVAGLGMAPQAVLGGLAAYPGIERRFSPVGQAAGIRVIDDYAHNVDKVSAVVQAGRAVTGEDGRLVVLFQPHLYSRTRESADGLAQALSAADLVVVLDVYASREDPIPGVTGQLIVDRLLARGGPQAHFQPSRPGAARRLVGLLQSGDLLLTVGAGDVTGVGPEVLRLLRQHEHPVDWPADPGIVEEG